MLRRACCGEEPLWDSQCQKHFSLPTFLLYRHEVTAWNIKWEPLNQTFILVEKIMSCNLSPEKMRLTPFLLQPSFLLQLLRETDLFCLEEKGLAGDLTALYSCPDPFPQDTLPATLPEPIPLHWWDPSAALSFVECHMTGLRPSTQPTQIHLQHSSPTWCHLLVSWWYTQTLHQHLMKIWLNEIGPTTIKNYVQRQMSADWQQNKYRGGAFTKSHFYVKL